MERTDLDILYHFTEEKYADKIMSEGLFSPDITGNQNDYNGVQGDTRFSYLWNESETRDIIEDIPRGKTPLDPDEAAIIKINIPSGQPLERDYDMLLYAAHENQPEYELCETISTYEDMFDIEFEADQKSDKALRKFLDKVPLEEWDNKVGAYRTPRAILPDNLKKTTTEKLKNEFKN